MDQNVWPYFVNGVRAAQVMPASGSQTVWVGSPSVSSPLFRTPAPPYSLSVCLSALHLSFHTPASASINPLPTQQPANQPVQASCYGNSCLGGIMLLFLTPPSPLSFCLCWVSLFSALSFPLICLSAQPLSPHQCVTVLPSKILPLHFVTSLPAKLTLQFF